jgi:ABC-type sugar transport system substrate-binding protein
LLFDDESGILANEHPTDGEDLKTVALLLDDAQNRYQQLLVRKAKDHALRLNLRLLEPQFAGDSSWNQLESINAYLRSEPLPDAILVLLAGEQHTGVWLERAIAKHIAVVFLNRVPPWLSVVRSKFPQALVTAVAPTQVAVGELQGAQALQLVRPGANVILVTGAARSPTAIERQRGFMDTVARQLKVHQVDGRWSAQEAEKALAEWLQLGGESARTIDLVVCQNDTMVIGARRAMSMHATMHGRPELANVPYIGCDGLEEEGQIMLRDGKLTATVVLPPTTPAALDILHRYWSSNVKADTVTLGVESAPPLERIRPL